MNKTILFTLLFSMTLIACSDKNSMNAPDLQSSFEIRTDPGFYINSDDPFYLNNAKVLGNDLLVDVSYGGGCGHVNFTLVSGGIFMESDPVQTNIYLNLEDSDPCEAFITKQLVFDLSELAQRYRESYQVSHGIIMLNLRDFSEPIPYVF